MELFVSFQLFKVGSLRGDVGVSKSKSLQTLLDAILVLKRFNC
jgi:hypothetical protein